MGTATVGRPRRYLLLAAVSSWLLALSGPDVDAAGAAGGGQPPSCTTTPTYAFAIAGQPLLLPHPLCSDPEGDPLTFTVVSGPSHGVIVPGPQPNTWYYTANADFQGNDVIGFRANDGTSDSNVHLWTMSVSSSNPPAVPDPVRSFVVPPTKLSAALRKGRLDLNSVCRPDAVVVDASVGIGKRTARKADIAKKPVKVASGRGTCTPGGDVIELRFTRPAKKRLKALRRVKFELVVTSAGEQLKKQTITLGEKAHPNL